MIICFWDERGGAFTRQPVGPFVDMANMTTAMNTIRARVIAHNVVHSGVHTRAQTLFGYFVSD